jgi:hypothetical protein
MKNFRGIGIFGFDEAVVGPPAVAARGDETGATQVREMA